MCYYSAFVFLLNATQHLEEIFSLWIVLELLRHVTRSYCEYLFSMFDVTQLFTRLETWYYLHDQQHKDYF